MNLPTAFLSAEAVTEALTEAVTTAAEVADPIAQTGTTVSDAFVVVMGLGVVFIGLICIILLLKLMSLVMTIATPASAAAAAPAPVAMPTAAPAAVPAQSTVIENRAEIVAAVCTAAAEELGTDVNALRVVSFKKIS